MRFWTQHKIEFSLPQVSHRKMWNLALHGSLDSMQVHLHKGHRYLVSLHHHVHALQRKTSHLERPHDHLRVFSSNGEKDRSSWVEKRKQTGSRLLLKNSENRSSWKIQCSRRTKTPLDNKKLPWSNSTSCSLILFQFQHRKWSCQGSNILKKMMKICLVSRMICEKEREDIPQDYYSRLVPPL